MRCITALLVVDDRAMILTAELAAADPHPKPGWAAPYIFTVQVPGGTYLLDATRILPGRILPGTVNWRKIPTRILPGWILYGTLKFSTVQVPVCWMLPGTKFTG